MIIRGQGAVLKTVFPGLGPGLQRNTCRGRCKSTKSAIYAALKNPVYRDDGPGGGPLRSRAGRTSAQDVTRSSYREKREERLRERSGKPNRGVQTFQRGSFNRGRQRESHSSRRPSASKGTVTLDQHVEKRDYTSVGNIQESHRSIHHEEEDGKLFESDKAKSSPARPPKTHAWSSLQGFQPEEKVFEVAEERATERRARQFGPRRPSEINPLGNGRYVGCGGTSQQDHEDTDPLRLPYTTPASEFLYGHGVVTAALRAGRRKLYKLYIYQSPQREDKKKDMDMRKMALNRGIPLERIPPDRLRILDRMSEGRPHNGFVLEASPLPRFPVTGFDRMTQPSEKFLVFLDHQSREDEEINGTDPRIKYNSAFPRFPFVLLLDGVLDPQNLGAILRSAFFLGVDAVALTTNRTAPLSPAALKASAGASECMPIITVSQTRLFLDECKKNGWKVYASSADPTSYGKSKGHKHRHLTISTLISDVSRRPCILILGSEGQGLYKDVQGAADNTISIEGPRQGEMGIDSLNVSVAAGLLCEALLRKPATVNEQPRYFNEADHLDLRIRDRLF